MAKWRSLLVLGAMIAFMSTAFAPTWAQEDRSELTRASYRRDCLMCHARAAPEGVSAEILAGLHPEAGLTPTIAMPNIICWRRCERCRSPKVNAPERP